MQKERMKTKKIEEKCKQKNSNYTYYTNIGVCDLTVLCMCKKEWTYQNRVANKHISSRPTSCPIIEKTNKTDKIICFTRKNFHMVLSCGVESGL